MSDVAYVNPVRRLGSVGFDTSVQEDHTSELTITSHPVEQGANISDNAIVQPKKVTINGAYSTVPFKSGSGILGSNSTRPQAAWEALVELQESKTLLEVQTGLKLYENMLIASLSASQDVSTSNALFFRAELVEVIIVSTAETAFPASKLAAGATADRVTSLVERGATATPQGKVAGSFLKSIFGS